MNAFNKKSQQQKARGTIMHVGEIFHVISPTISGRPLPSYGGQFP